MNEEVRYFFSNLIVRRWLRIGFFELIKERALDCEREAFHGTEFL